MLAYRAYMSIIAGHGRFDDARTCDVLRAVPIEYDFMDETLEGNSHGRENYGEEGELESSG